jgi:hypothetical protein
MSPQDFQCITSEALYISATVRVSITVENLRQARVTRQSGRRAGATELSSLDLPSIAAVLVGNSIDKFLQDFSRREVSLPFPHLGLT